MRIGTTSNRILAVTFWITATAFPVFGQTAGPKLGPLARAEAARGRGWSPVIVRAVDRHSLDSISEVVALAGGQAGRELPIINARVALMPNAALEGLANHPRVAGIAIDRSVRGSVERTGATIGATLVRQQYGYDGSGVGIAIIDSGITSWHDDLAGPGGQRVVEFVDFVSGAPSAYDDYGHGTHVAGIVAGSGYDSSGARTGIAPGAHLLILKALDATGSGRISDVIAALDHILMRRAALNIRVVNLSLSAGVYDNYAEDPLTLATRNVVKAGIVVVAAAGNGGRDASGQPVYGGVTAPGNAPWVLTVGASNHQGTASRDDDGVAPFSARGPAAVANNAKPDILAPGVGIESLSDPSSTLYTTKVAFLIGGTVPTPYPPYLSLSGTSMAAPVVTGTVALMMQAHPALTPNAVKAILQYTAQVYAGYDALTQGAGFLNARGAVELARHFASPADVPYPSSSNWTAQIIWGNQLLRRGRPLPEANAWASSVIWGDVRTAEGENVWWGVSQDEQKNTWGTKCLDESCLTVQWGFGKAQNVVWGSTCSGADCTGTWSAATVSGAVTDPTAATIVWGSTVVWGSTEGDTVVWGSTEGDTVVWGSWCAGAWCDVLWNPDIR